MIRRTTVTALGLKPVTQSMCQSFFVKINTEFEGPDAIKESVSWWQDDHDMLNQLWWVLNYHAEQLDPDRSIRACVEKQLDFLAMTKQKRPDPPPDQDNLS